MNEFLCENLKKLEDNIAAACQKAGRDRSEVTTHQFHGKVLRYVPDPKIRLAAYQLTCPWRNPYQIPEYPKHQADNLPDHPV